jgi:hypothetical protein
VGLHPWRDRRAASASDLHGAEGGELVWCSTRALEAEGEHSTSRVSSHAQTQEKLLDM